MPTQERVGGLCDLDYRGSRHDRVETPAGPWERRVEVGPDRTEVPAPGEWLGGRLESPSRPEQHWNRQISQNYWYLPSVHLTWEERDTCCLLMTDLSFASVNKEITSVLNPCFSSSWPDVQTPGGWNTVRFHWTYFPHGTVTKEWGICSGVSFPWLSPRLKVHPAVMPTCLFCPAPAPGSFFHWMFCWLLLFSLLQNC